MTYSEYIIIKPGLTFSGKPKMFHIFMLFGSLACFIKVQQYILNPESLLHMRKWCPGSKKSEDKVVNALLKIQSIKLSMTTMWYTLGVISILKPQ